MLFVIFRHVTAFGFERPILLRTADGHIPVFTTDVLARTYLAGVFRPTDDDYFIEKRAVRLTRRHVVDPQPPAPPMAA